MRYPNRFELQNGARWRSGG